MIYILGFLFLLAAINPLAFFAVMGLSALTLLALKLYFAIEQLQRNSGRKQQP